MFVFVLYLVYLMLSDSLDCLFFIAPLIFSNVYLYMHFYESGGGKLVLLLITECVNRLTRRVPLVVQELLTLREHLSSSPVFSGVRVTRCLVLCVCLVDRCLSFCTFSFGHWFVCSSSLCGFWLPLWYLQIPLIDKDLSSIWNDEIMQVS